MASMMSVSGGMVRGLVGTVADPDGWAGPIALVQLPAVPAVALVEVGAAAVQAVGRGVSWLRRAAARMLRSVAFQLDRAAATLERTDAAPVATVADHATGSVRLAEDAPAPVLVMASAAQETVEAAPVATVEATDYAALVKAHGSQRAAAAACGLPISTFRSRLIRQRAAQD